MTFGDDGEKIEGDGTNLTISSSGTTTIDSTGNITIDGSNITAFAAAGTEFLQIINSSGSAHFKNSGQDNDILFQGNDGGSGITALTLDMSEAGNATFNGTVTTPGLILGSTAVTSTAAELNLLDGVSGLVQADLTKLAAVDSTAAELNIVDGGTSATSTTVVDADRVVFNDAGTMVQVAMSDIKTYMGAAEANTPSFFGCGAAATSIANATLTKIAARTEKFDDGGCFNNTASSATLNSLTAPADCFTPNVAGLYYFVGAIKLNTANFNVGLVNNIGSVGGSESYAALKYQLGTANNTVIVSGYSLMNGSGNNICLAASQESGGTISTNDATYTTYFGGFLVKAS